MVICVAGCGKADSDNDSIVIWQKHFKLPRGNINFLNFFVFFFPYVILSYIILTQGNDLFISGPARNCHMDLHIF